MGEAAKWYVGSEGQETIEETELTELHPVPSGQGKLYDKILEKGTQKRFVIGI